MRVLVAVLGLASAARPAGAADLDAFLTSAVLTSPRIAAQRADVELARSDVLHALSDLLPRVRAFGTYRHNQFDAVFPDQAGDEIVIQLRDELFGEARVDVPLLDATAVLRTVGARSGARAADADLFAETQRVLLEVVEAYWDTRTAGRTQDAAQVALEAAEATLERTAIRVAAGLSTELQRRRDEAEAARAAETLARARADHAAAERRLVALSGLDEPATGDTVRPPPGAPVEALVAAAVASKAEVVAARALVTAAAREVQGAAASWAPTLEAFALERAQNATSFIQSPFEYEVGVTARWDPLLGGARIADLRTARARLAAARARLRDAERAADDDVRDAADELTAARTAVEAARRRRLSADEALRLTRVEVDTGRLGPADAVLALRDAFDAAVAEAEAQARLAVSVERLRAAAGEPLWREP